MIASADQPLAFTIETRMDKSRERSVFDLVYGDRDPLSITSSERPDFIVQNRVSEAPFGVEITEVYPSETFARLEHIDGYGLSLIQGGKFRHKDDCRALTVSPIDIVAEDGTPKALKIPALIQELPRLIDCPKKVADAITEKTAKFASTDSLRHVNLIIREHSKKFWPIPVSDFHYFFFTPEIINAISSSPFREIYLVIDLDRKSVFVPLKMFHIVAELRLYGSMLLDRFPDQELPKNLDELQLFASYFRSQVRSPVLYRREQDGEEIIYGDCGVLIQHDGATIVRLYSDHCYPKDTIEPNLDWSSELGNGVVDELIDYRVHNKFVFDGVFPVCGKAK